MSDLLQELVIQDVPGVNKLLFPRLLRCFSAAAASRRHQSKEGKQQIQPHLCLLSGLIVTEVGADMG